MGYTPPNTFVAGNPLLAAHVEGNLSAFKEYLNGGVAAGTTDMEAVSWCETKHIMRPVYETVPATMSFVTGFQGGKSRTYPAELFAAVSRYSTMRIGSGSADPLSLDDAPMNYIQNTTVKIEVPRACRFLLFQYSVGPISPYQDVNAPSASPPGPGGNTRSEYQIYFSPQSPPDLNSINSGLYGRSQTRSYTWAESPVTGGQYAWKRWAGNGFSLETNLAEGTYYLGLVGKSDLPYTLFRRWSISVEVWTD